MKEIQNVLICGIGAVGSIYANRINKYNSESLKVLVDKVRLENYTKNPKTFNGEKMIFNYILPQDTSYKADLIIIATKYDGLFEAIKNIKNFIKEDTIILSLLNGVTSEELISEKYGEKHLLYSYYIGHSTMRSGNDIIHDGVGKIIFGAKTSSQKNNIELLKTFFEKVGIDYEIPDDIYHSMWLKYMLNVGSNQPSAILGMTFGQMQKNKKFMEFFINIMKEVQVLAKAEGVKNTDTMIDEAITAFNKMSPEGKTSMLQDVEAKRKTEVEMFAGHVIKLGKKYHISTPYNETIKELIEIIQNNY